MYARLKEINDRKLEIRSSLKGDASELDLDAIEKELGELGSEEVELRRRQDIANKISSGDLPAEVIEKPVELRVKGNEGMEIDKFDSLEYRSAFFKHITKGEAMPVEYRSSTTADAGIVIPTSTLNKIIERMQVSGDILALVTKTAFAGGQSVPVGGLKPVATWVSEGQGSAKQTKAVGNVVFGYNKLRCAVSVSFEMDNLSMAAFETLIINNVAEAMTVSLENAIINGTGNGQPKGILKENGENIRAEKLSYSLLCDAEGALPLEYDRNAVWVMSKKTFAGFIGLVDENGQPVARVDHGLNRGSERSLLGRKVVLCNHINNYDETASDGTAFAFLFDMSDYILNTSFGVNIVKYTDHDTDDKVTRAIMLVDGKVIDAGSLVTLIHA